MLLQSLKLDGFETREVSMDIVKNNEDIGYTTFRNTLVEKRISLLYIHELIREIINLEKNESTGKVDHPRQVQHIEKDRNHNKISRERFFRFSRWCYI